MNGAGGKTHYDYDELGRVASITNPAGGVTRRTYTALSRVATLTDPLGRVTTGRYDQAGKQLTQTDPDGREVAWEYDADGQPCGLSGDGAPLTATETDHRTHTVTATDHTRRGTGPVSHRIVRDRLGRMIERTRDGETTRWEYDGDGLRTLMVTPAGEEVRYGYDRAGRVTRVEHSAFGAISYDYDPSGNLVAATAGDTAQAWRYDDGYPVEHTLTTGDGVETTRISRGEGGRITEIADASGSTAYGYDGAEQLVRAEHRDGGGASTLHAWEYDLAGRLVFDRGAEGETRYDYDVAGQLSRCVAVHGSGDDGATTYAYDGAGRRTLEAGPHGEKRYEWDTRGWLSAITDGTSTHRLWVDGYGELAAIGDDPVSWDSAARFPALTGLGADPVFAAPGGMTGLGTTLAPTGWRQARSTSVLHPWDITGAFQPGSPLAPGIGVTGHGTPTIGGLEWMGARAYDRVTRGFLSVDPLEPVTGAGWAGNPYAYAGNDPLHALDPLGLSPVTDKDLLAAGRAFGIDIAKHRMLSPLVLALMAHLPNDFLKSLLSTQQGRLIVGWALGTSPKLTRYGPSAEITTAIRNHRSADALRKELQIAGQQGALWDKKFTGGYAAGKPVQLRRLELGAYATIFPALSGNMTRDILTALGYPSASNEERTLLSLGTYDLEATVLAAVQGSATVRFTATNQSTLGSAISPFAELRPFFDSIPGRSGALSQVGQEMTWTEEVHW